MACINSLPLQQMDTEREEGEIVDDLDELSDISSEEEYLLRQRLQVLENYNNVLERKEAKYSSNKSDHKKENELSTLCDLSDVSMTNFEDELMSPKHVNRNKSNKFIHHKHRRKKEYVSPRQNVKPNNIELKKKYSKLCKKTEIKIISDSSEEENDHEHKLKRVKLANALSVPKNKTGSSLKSRLMSMLGHNNKHSKQGNILGKSRKSINKISVCPNPPEICNIEQLESKDAKNSLIALDVEEVTKLPNEEESVQIVNCCENMSIDVVDSAIKKPNVDDKNIDENSDEDLEILRQHALKSKIDKNQVQKVLDNNDLLSETPLEDEDSDTAELRIICLRSALLKKAIEMKQKQKLRKRLSQSTSLYDEIISNDAELQAMKSDIENNTDIESVDMDIGSDHDCKAEIICNDNIESKNNKSDEIKKLNSEILSKEDDLDEDEDLLRAKLLTSLSKNLPLLVNIENKETAKLGSVDGTCVSKMSDSTTTTETVARFIVNTADSDSETEDEATKNLTIMHKQLSDSIDFQQKLDMFLKTARLEVEQNKLPDVVQKQSVLPLPKTPQKFVPKAVNHLPKSEQVEYNNLVKRMAELKKIKQARQVSINILNNRKSNESKDNIQNKMPPVNLDKQIDLSRKKIAEESQRILQLKQEETKLSQKYKIVLTELRNLTTAITLNKKQQTAVQMKLSKIRTQHSMLLKRSNHTFNTNTKKINKVHPKENGASKISKSELKSVKISVVNDLQEQAAAAAADQNFVIKLDVSNNKKIVKVPKDTKITEVDSQNVSNDNNKLKVANEEKQEKQDDYQSPLQAIRATGSWNEDPNGVLCPFEVGGSCKDPNCKYLHPSVQSH